jgi:hypothetical protein
VLMGVFQAWRRMRQACSTGTRTGKVRAREQA